jgi:hypothetical protein
VLAGIEIWLNKQQKTMSPLIQKLQRLGITKAEELAALATQRRGCIYYRPATEDIKAPAISERQLSNEELAIALLSSFWPEEQVNIRIGAMRLSGDCKASTLVQLAKEEGATHILGHIAACGQEIEPHSKFWEEIRRELPPQKPEAEKRIGPHRSRFIWETGITNPFVPNQPKRGWLRPKNNVLGMER